MSNNIGRTTVTESQNQKEVTINDSDGRIDAALTELLSSDYSSADVTLTTSQFQQSVTFVTSGLSVPRLLNVPQVKKLFIVDNTAGTSTLTVTRGSGTVVIGDGDRRLCYTNGTTNGLIEVGAATANTFLSLPDTPGSYAGQAGRVAAVNVGETAMEFVDQTVDVLDWKQSVRIATTAALTLASDFENGDTVDGVVLATNDRILIKDQASGAENGIYTVNASGAPTRATDADEDAEVTSGMTCYVEEGTANNGLIFLLVTIDPITVGATVLVFAVLSAGGGVSEFTALTDTPGSYAGQAGKVAVVNGAENAMEFVGQAVGGGGGGGVGVNGSAIAYPSVVQTVPTDTWTPIVLDLEDHDDSNWHDLATNNSRMTVPAGVTKVVVVANIMWTVSVAGSFRLGRITKNGADFNGGPRADTADTASAGAVNLATSVLDVVAGDYFELEGYQNSGGNLDTLISENRVWLGIFDMTAGVTAGGGVGVAGSALVFPTVGQVIPSGMFTVIDFDDEDHDDSLWHDNVTNNSRFTVPAGVTKILVNASATFNSGTGNRRIFRIIKNGISGELTGLPRSTISGDPSIPGTELTSAIINVISGDFFELEMWHNNAGNLNTDEFATWFAIADMTPSSANGGGGVGVEGSALVNKTGTQSITTSVVTPLAWDTEDHDDSDWHDNSVNNTRITVPIGVTKIELSAGVRWDTNSSGARIVQLHKNGASFPGSARIDDVGNVSAGNMTKNIKSGVLDVVPGDYFEIVVTQTSGGNLDVVNHDTTWFAAHDMSPSSVSSGGGAWKLLDETVFSGIAAPTLDWINPELYSEIKIVFENITTDTDDSRVFGYARQGGVSRVGATDYSLQATFNVAADAAVNVGGSNNLALAVMAASAALDGLGNGAGESFGGSLVFNDPGNSGLYKDANFSVAYTNTTTQAVVVKGAGFLTLNTNPIDGLEISEFVSGALLSGTMRAYGLKKA